MKKNKPLSFTRKKLYPHCDIITLLCQHGYDKQKIAYYLHCDMRTLAVFIDQMIEDGYNIPAHYKTQCANTSAS